MIKETFDTESITKYLLGTLPEAEEARMDELSVSDDEFIASLQSVENDLVDAYVRGELSGSTLEEFNSHYLASPIRREKVSFAKAFKDYSNQNFDSQPARVKGVTSTKAGKTSAWGAISNFFTVRRTSYQWGLAVAMLFLVLAGAWLVFENYRLRRQTSDAQAKQSELQQRERQLQVDLENARERSAEKEEELARVRDELARMAQEKEQQSITAPKTEGSSGKATVASFMLAAPRRSTGQLHTLIIPRSTERVSLQLELESEDYRAYRGDLQDQTTGRVLWRSGNLRPGTKGNRQTIGFSLPSRLLPPGVYLIKVYGISSGNDAEIIGSYPFRVANR